MRLLIHSYEEPALNLAYEQLMFERFEEETLRLWVNPTSVVSGKHQNALAECNFHYCRMNNIPVIRRISGGGTVFHDQGNINFSFFRTVDSKKMIDYERNLIIVRDALNALGYPVLMNERHDLFLGQNKVSGNAQHMRQGKALHHGTLLYDADEALLRNAIKRTSGTFTDKAVKSVRSSVQNLRRHKDLGAPLAFLQRFADTIGSISGATTIENEIPFSEVEHLARDRYDQEKWNFGYSPRYIFENGDDRFSVRLEVERGGEINSAIVTEHGNRQHAMESKLEGAYHFYTHLSNLLVSSEERMVLKLLF